MKSLIAALTLTALAAPVMVEPAAAQQRYDRSHSDRGSRDYRWQGDNNRNWEPSSSYRSGNYRERRLGRNDRIYRGRDGRAYCRRSDGSTGLVVGGVAGGLLANLVGGGTLGTLAGAGGGALLGRSIDRGNVKCR